MSGHLAALLGREGAPTLDIVSRLHAGVYHERDERVGFLMLASREP
jgi:hypothetical protein